MTRTFLTAANPGDYLEEVFVVSNKQLSTTQTGKPFIKCFVGDRTRQVPARMWNATQGMFNAMPEGGFLRLAGKIESYQENLQFIIDRFWIIEDPSEIVLEHLMPYTTKDIPQMFERLTTLVRSVRNKHLLSLVNAYLNDQPLMEKFRRSPAATTFHHSFIGGLLEHTLNMLEVADSICQHYPLISRDLVIAGVFLHDIAKTWELSCESAFAYTDGGHLVGHIVKGAIWVELKAKEAEAATGEAIPCALVDVMQHLILSHHGEPEYGAARVPASPEAILIHYIDNIDAKLTMSLGATRDPSNTGEGNFTEYQKALGVRLYRPNVAPADIDVEPVAKGAGGASAQPVTETKRSMHT
jgi:3'-5' exoribonuclease